MSYKINDVVLTTQEYGSRKLVIIEILSHGYKAMSLGVKKFYTINDSHIENKVDEFNIESQKANFNPELMRRFCEKQARLFPLEADKWLFLSTLIPGDSICLIHRDAKFESAEFCSINTQKQIYPIRAKIKGMLHDFRLRALILPSLDR